MAYPVPSQTGTIRLAPLFAGCALAGCVFAACSTKQEASSLLVAIDRYQRADNVAKAREADAVAAVACSDPQVCEAKRTCLAAIEPTARALTLKEEVAARIEDLQAKRLAPDAPAAQELPTELDRAAKLLEEGRAMFPACERKLAELRVAAGG
jgi:hypothetical protein